VKVNMHWIMATNVLAKKMLIQFQAMGKELSGKHTTQFSYRGYVDGYAYQVKKNKKKK
jgi:hypothetical protein